MTLPLETAVILVVIVLVASLVLAVVTLSLRFRARASAEIGRLAGELADRMRAVEAVAARLEASAASQDGARPESGITGRLSAPVGPRNTVRRVDAGEPSAIAGPTLIAVPDLASPPGEAAQAASELARRFGAIWSLADSGASAESIARDTGQPIGHVELILGLRRQLEAAGTRAGAGSQTS